jgi:hypothetical protein
MASREFERSVVQRLSTCGVKARVGSADRMDPTPPKSRIEDALAELEAHTVMVVKAAGDPGCLADQREERRRAKRITDDREQFRALNALPDCR